MSPESRKRAAGARERMAVHFRATDDAVLQAVVTDSLYGEENERGDLEPTTTMDCVGRCQYTCEMLWQPSSDQPLAAAEMLIVAATLMGAEDILELADRVVDPVTWLDRNKERGEASRGE